MEIRTVFMEIPTANTSASVSRLSNKAFTIPIHSGKTGSSVAHVSTPCQSTGSTLGLATLIEYPLSPPYAN